MSDTVKIEVYYADGCDYCTGAIHLLERKGVDIIRHRVDETPAVRAEMERRSQQTSVPQIFIGGRHVGGFDELVELDMDDELDPLLGLTQA
ncbi:MAG TPA: glutaredoxin 3 [Gammaproteobacteria bacterium]|nr:glutaredoxin 3 [Gammaproteobacteria bacterium]